MRLVLNHSTHIDGLIKILKKLCEKIPEGTCTPGRINTARANIPNLTLRISVPIKGGFKINARKGKSAQEVFIICPLEEKELKKMIKKLLKS